MHEARSISRGEPSRRTRRGGKSHIYTPPPAAPSITALSELLAEAVYAVRTKDDLIKIGFTTDVRGRIATHGGWSTVLVVVPGTLEHEQALHAGLVEHRARGQEYYRPEAVIFDWLDTVRDSMGLSTVKRWSLTG